MSNFNDHYDLSKFNFSFNEFPTYPFTTPKPPRKQEPAFWLFGYLAAIFVILGIIRKFCCKKEQNEPGTTTIYSNDYNPQMSGSVPVSIIISESSRFSPSSNYMSNQLSTRPPTTFTPSVLDVGYFQPQVFQPSAPRIVEDSIPKYDNPPNYEEAITMIRQQNQKMDAGNLSNTISTEQSSSNTHQPHDTHL